METRGAELRQQVRGGRGVRQVQAEHRAEQRQLVLEADRARPFGEHRADRLGRVRPGQAEQPTQQALPE